MRLQAWIIKRVASIIYVAAGIPLPHNPRHLAAVVSAPYSSIMGQFTEPCKLVQAVMSPSALMKEMMTMAQNLTTRLECIWCK